MALTLGPSFLIRRELDEGRGPHLPPSLKCPSPGLGITSHCLAVGEATGWQVCIRLVCPQVGLGGRTGSCCEKEGRQCR